MSNSFATPWMIALQATLSMKFSRQEYGIGLPFLPPGDLPDPGIKLASLTLQVDSLPLSHQEKVSQSCSLCCLANPSVLDTASLKIEFCFQLSWHYFFSLTYSFYSTTLILKSDYNSEYLFFYNSEYLILLLNIHFYSFMFPCTTWKTCHY